MHNAEGFCKTDKIPMNKIREQVPNLCRYFSKVVQKIKKNSGDELYKLQRILTIAAIMSMQPK